jgi:hypothetical protein
LKAEVWERYIDTSFYAIASWNNGYDFQSRRPRVFLPIVLFVLPASGSADAAKRPPVNVRLTGIMIDPEDAPGATSNAPGAWSTNLADPLYQVGVMSRGDFLNGTPSGIGLGEISISP